MKNIIDTHTLLWFVQNDKRLGPNAERVLSDPASELVLPATAYGEACWIVEHGRTNIASVADLRSVIDADPRWVLHPLDREVIDASQTLTTINEMHDRQIVATALILARHGHVVALLTHDSNITASRVVPVIW